MTTCWAGLGFFVVMLLVLVGFNVYAYSQIRHQAKRRMRTVSRNIIQEIKTSGGATGGIAPDAMLAIEEKMPFLDPDRKLKYAVVNGDHTVLYSTFPSGFPIARALADTVHRKVTLQRVKSGDDLKEVFSEWYFLYRYDEDDLTILTSSREDYELAERFVEGFGVAVVLSLILALPAGALLSRRVLVPLKAIDSTVQKIAAGQLDARITFPTSKDEVSALIETLNRTFAELEKSFQRIRQFSADAAHELKTPLTALRGNMEVCLSRTRTAEDYQRVLAESITEVASLTNLVDNLLLLASPSDPERETRFVEVNLASLVRDAVERATAMAVAKEIRITQNIEDNVPVQGDDVLLTRICNNLLYNAVRFSPNSTIVTVSLRLSPNAVVLEVIDQGIGIKPEDHKRIFERFCQIDTSRSTGSGLGLAIVKWIADLHNARIEVESEPGQGSLFRVVLPRVD